MSPIERAARIKEIALQAGFDRAGIARAERVPHAGFLAEWLERGCAGGMAYLHRNRETRENPAGMLTGAKSILVVALNYYQASPQIDADVPPHGRIARYAWGDDYHDVLRERLRKLVETLRRELNEPFDSRICVDTAPILEREIAAAAGIGWIGKNTLVLNEEIGSYFFLGEIITSLDAAGDKPATDHCGTCTQCLDACPTKALVQPHIMDASRCISYLTIEHRGEIPAEFHEAIGDRLYGCDICQDVCPYNHRVPATNEPAFAIRPPAPSVSPDEILNWSDEQYAQALSGSAMKRAKLDMLKRNAAIVKANS